MSTTTDAIGRVLADRYRLEAVIGTGASAHVFAALDVALQRRVAIKVLHPALAGEPGFLRRFRAEAQAAAALNHPHVVGIYDWGEDDSSPFLVLELFAGGSLRDLLDTGRRLSVAQAVAIGRQAADALAFAHGRGVVHRDVKPANLLFDGEGRLAVADFGLARALSEAAWTEPAGATVGTARYASPEQATGATVDGRGDVYALALVLYEVVTGTVPFAADTTIATLMARVGATLPGHDALGPLSALLRRAASPVPPERPDAPELRDLLADLAADLPDPGPLPLAGARAGRGSAAPDRTELGLVPGAVPAGRRSAALSDPLALATAVGVAEAEPAAGRRRRRRGTAAEGDAGEGRAHAAALTAETAGPSPGAADGDGDLGARRRRRWPWVVAALVVVAGLAGAGAAYAVRDKVFVASHRLPALVSLSTSRADAALQRYHDHVQVLRRRYSTTAAAGTVLRQIPAAGTAVKDGSSVDVVVSSGPPPVAVPDLTGVSGSCSAFGQALAASHLLATCTSQSSTTVAAGHAVSWSPRSTATEGSTVTVVVSSGPPFVTVPGLSGITSCAGVSSAFHAVGLVAQCSTAYDSAPAGSVVSEQPATQARLGGTVTVVLSKGPPPVVVPNVTNGMPLDKAIAVLEQAGLTVGNIFGPGSGVVFHTNPAPGASVSQGTPVTVYTQ